MVGEVSFGEGRTRRRADGCIAVASLATARPDQRSVDQARAALTGFIAPGYNDMKGGSGEVIHQDQEHIGKYGGERRFPDEWTGATTINAPAHQPRPGR